LKLISLPFVFMRAVGSRRVRKALRSR
jgi:hypothetical protein